MTMASDIEVKIQGARKQEVIFSILKTRKKW